MSEVNLFKYGDFEGELDRTDYVQLEAFESGLEAFQKATEEIQGVEKESEIWRTIIEAITEEVFIPLFGEDCLELIFGRRLTSGMVTLEAFIALLENAVNNQFMTLDRMGEMQKRITSISGNRQTRRTAPKR